MIDLWGGWSLFQELLGVLDGIAKRKGNGADISNIATRYILDKPYVGAVIVGARLGLSEHMKQNLKTFDFSLDAKDNAEIEAILKRSNSERMLAIVGDCGGEYRG
jgi:aryl-alcohol dehydrogenase-like predicted oxidoreductase